MLKAIIAAYKKRAIYRATHRELSRLTNRELYDIGIDRYGIEIIAKESAYGIDAEPRFNHIFKFFKVKTENQKRDEYLAESVSIMDLENRIKSIDRGLAPWQINGKSYAQGLLQ